ncbi:ABC transporter permease [Cellulosilyticum lentocellum]|uniref:ABC-type transporter, integral membrane subunit n=1 Tax=Cellulosilyticum lentocellum (strain ATCC 49066 / DSM 5427 / NCIMB 11756 / RHM5) TaxID=642492 RepID=F2JRD3_CELLD|nr:ABC-type transporter, integral membrane subunit [Cellulosilyticum lentocellum DSM 5427]
MHSLQRGVSNILVKTNKNVGTIKKMTVWSRMKEQKYLIAMSAPFVIWVIIFKYLPLTGWAMAFQDYKPQLGITKSPWVGLKHFKVLFKEEQFYQALQNTLGMSILAIVFSTIFSISFALLLNELRSLKFKRLIQTISYLPHFVSWVVVANIVGQILAPTGTINEILMNLHIINTPINFLAKPSMFWGIVTASDLWKETGWNAIIYLAAITGIDMQLYEAAKVDGANRWQQIKNITLPGIKATAIILLIMSIGNLINIGFEKQYLLGNNTVAAKSLVLDKYALDYGIGMVRYSYGTAIGMFKSVVGIVLIFIANTLAKKSGEGRLI